ncbi:MAG: aldolase [Clostridia bacterium]|nr:aldolase [Clostridia bacterium]
MDGKELKRKLKSREYVFGTQVLMDDTATAEIFAQIGYDFLWIDTEHSPMDYSTLLKHITISEAVGTPTLIRLHIDDYNHTKRVLEMGPSGVIFPMINTREEAEKAIASTYYPPRGNRGIGAQRYQRYGLDGFGRIIEKQDDIVRCVQIESKKAIDNLEEIVKVEGIDCFIFGFYDLSFDIGKPADVFSEEETEYIARAVKILKDNGKSIGMATGNTDKEFLKGFAKLGINCFTSGSDFDYLRVGAVENLKNLKNGIK